MTRDEVGGLRAVAEAATPGPWRWTHGMDSRAMVLATDDTFRVKVDGHADAAYIAAVSPDVLLGLLDRLDAAWRLVELWHNYSHTVRYGQELARALNGPETAASVPVSAQTGESAPEGHPDAAGLSGAQCVAASNVRAECEALADEQPELRCPCGRAPGLTAPDHACNDRCDEGRGCYVLPEGAGRDA